MSVSVCLWVCGGICCIRLPSIHPPILLDTSSPAFIRSMLSLSSPRVQTVAPSLSLWVSFVCPEQIPISVFESGLGIQPNSGPWSTRLFLGERKTATSLFRESNEKSHPAFLWLVQYKSMTCGTAAAISALRREPTWGQSQCKEEAKRRGPQGSGDRVLLDWTAYNQTLTPGLPSSMRQYILFSI